MERNSIRDFLGRDRPQVLISSKEMQERIRELGEMISRDYADKVPILVGVLNGAFIFMADLVRNLTIDCEVDFVKISSYGNAKESSGRIRMLKDLDADIEGRHVIVVEDIVDSGLSVQWLRRHFESRKPQSLRFVTLLKKKGAAKVAYEVEYVGFEIPNAFVVGYGLDVAQRLRNLPDIYVLEDD